MTFLILFLQLSQSFAQGQSATEESANYFKPELILKFADNLYGEGDYLRAAGEYGRYLYLAGDIDAADSVYYKIIKAVYLAEDYPECLRLLDSFQSRYPNSSRNSDIPLYRSIVEYKLGKYAESIPLARDNPSSMPQLNNNAIAVSYLSLRDLTNAELWACGGIPETPRGDSPLFKQHLDYADYLCRNIKAADTLSHKSGLTAGLMSAVIPGSGKVYCNRTMDGLYSLIIVGLSVWQAYDGFADDGVRSTRGWILGALGAGFYGGNIYGSVIAADQHNRSVFRGFLTGLRIEIDLP